jgi:glyoxylase-like metal-dependent hydrolase (beta-lactamase superfamily II)
MTKRNRRKILLLVLAVLGAALTAVFAIGFRATTHPSERASLGVASSSDALEASLGKPGPVVIETIVAADWEVERAGLINLDHADAKKEGLSNGPEPIQIYFHVLRHPEKGTFLVDTGVERALKADPESAAIRGLVARFMNAEKMKVHTDTATFLEREASPPAGVLMTHLHLDHISGMPDVPKGTPVFTGPGEGSARAALFAFVQGSTNRALAGHAPLSELPFAPDPSGRFAGVLDLFGDESVWAIWVPGHTPGSVAYLARTPDGPVLFVGDTCHTAWGWEHGVEPGSFTADQPLNATSLRSLKALVGRHPQIDVRLGHQPLAGRQQRPVVASGNGAQ